MVYLYSKNTTITHLKVSNLQQIYRTYKIFSQIDAQIFKDLRQKRKYVICKKALRYKPCSQNPYEANFKTIQA
jgi:hypothetical protein